MPSPRDNGAQAAPVYLDDSGNPVASIPQTSALQGAVSFATQQDPDHYAKLLRFQKLFGVPPVVSAGNEKQLQQSADQQSIDPHQFVANAPRTAAWASNPDNAAVSGVSELHRLGSIEQNAASMRAYTPGWGEQAATALRGAFHTITGKTTDQVAQGLYEYPLTRSAIDAVGGTAGMVGNIGSSVGWHGDGPTKQNLLQRIESGLSPEANVDPNATFAKSNDLDFIAKNVAPMIPAVLATGSVGAVARLMGWSTNAAKVMSALVVGGMFTADQSGKTYTQVAGSGGSDDAARLAANRTAAINAIPNALMGFTDMIPGVNKFPLLSALGAGGMTGAAGQLSQNVVTGKPWSQDVGKGALQGAAMMGGMHIGMGAFSDHLGAAVDAAADSPLKARSPEKFQEAMHTVFEGDPSLRIPAEQFNEYFKGKGMDPAAVASELGSTNHTEAAMSGGDVEVPTDSFISKLDPEHQKALLPDVVDPASGLTMRQQEQGRQELAAWASNGGPERMQADARAADAESAGNPEYVQIKNEISQRLQDGQGKTPEEADTIAEVEAKGYMNASKAGMTPMELFRAKNPQYVSGEAPSGSAADPIATRAMPEEVAPAVAEEPTPRREDTVAAPEEVAADGGNIPAGRTGWMKLSDLHVDPERFQYKSGTSAETGVTDQFSDLEKYDHELAGTIQVWKDPEDGKTYVVNGHHRHELATRSGEEGMNVLRIDAPNAREARAKGALSNIADGKGTAFDAAKYFRDSGETIESLKGKRVSLKAGIAREGFAMSRLAPEIFDDTVQGRISKARAVALGESTDDHAVQQETLKKVREKEAGGAPKVSDAWVAEYARQITLAGGASGVEDTGSLFGGMTTDSLIDQRTDATTYIRAQLAKEKTALGVAADAAKGAKIGKVKGNKINPKESAKAAALADQDRLTFEVESRKTGAVNDAINDAAKRLSAGDKKSDVLNEAFVNQISARLRETDSRGPQAHGGNVPEGTGNTKGVEPAGEVAPGDPLFQTKRRMAPNGEGLFAPLRSDEDVAANKAALEKQAMEERMATPLGSIDKASGDIERSPLFSDNPTSRDALLFQSGGDEGQAQGWYRAKPDGTIEYGNTPFGDPSTPIHEQLGHGSYDLLTTLASMPNASEQLRSDLDTVHGWMGVKPGENPTRDQLESYGRAVELYFTKGEAPTPGLRGAFQRIAVWLGSVYKDAMSRLGVEISPELRGVFDRWFAADEAVNKVARESSPRPIASPEEAGWAKEDYEKYAKDNDMSVERAKSTIVGLLNDAAVRDRKQDWRDEEANVRQTMTQRADAEPEYKAIKSLRKGELEDGTPLTMSRESLVAQFGEDRVKALQQLHPGLYRTEGGVDAETAAEIHGFSSAEDMMRTLEATPRRSAAIEQATRAYMTEKHGDIRYDGTLDDQARLALENDSRSNALYAELKAYKQKVADLQGKGGKEGPKIEIAPIASYREAAEQMVNSKAIADLQPTRYLDASRKYSSEAFEALRKGDVNAAAEAKHKELLNHFLFREATAAKVVHEKNMAFYNRIMRASDKNASKTRVLDLVNAARAILAFVRIGPDGAAGKAIESLDALRKYNPDLYDELAPEINDAVMKGQNGYRKMTVAELNDLRQTIDTLWHRSRRDMQVFVEGKLQNREDIVRGLNSRLNDIGPRKRQPGVSTAVTTKDRFISAVDDIHAATRRIEHWADSVDGGPGVFTKALVRPVLEALTDYRLQRVEYMRRYNEIVADVDAKTQKIDAPELGYTFGSANGGLGKYELLGAIMHTGNPSNMRKLLLGRNWGELGPMGDVDPSHWDAFMQRMTDTGVITKQDMDTVQKVWDLNEDMKPQAQATYHELYGYYFKEIEHVPVQTPFGVYRGGYVPAKVDPNMVRDAQRNQKMEEMESDFRNSMPSTGAGFTNSRVEYNKPLSLDLRLIGKHIDDTLRFSMVQPAIKDVLSLMKDRSFNETLGKVDPTAMEKMLLPWLNRSARQTSSEPGMFPVVDKFWNAIRQRVGAATMMGNVANMLIHIPNGFLSAEKVGYLPMIRSSFAHFMGDPTALTSAIVEKSPYMKTRLDGQMKEITRNINNILENKGPVGKAQDWGIDHAYFLQHSIWNMNDVITWHAAYNKAFGDIGSTMTPDEAGPEAVSRADATVRMTQGADNPEDIPRYMAATPFLKTLLQFSGWSNNMGNLQLTEGAKAVQANGWKGAAPRLAILALSMAAMNTVGDGMTALARGEFDTDEPMLPQILRWFFGAQARSATSMVPFGGVANAAVTSIASAAQGNYAPSQNDRITSSPSTTMLQSSTVGAGKALHDLISDDKQVTGKDVHDVMTLMGIMTKTPLLSPIGSRVAYQMDVNSGKVNPTSTADYVRGMVTGVASKGSKPQHATQ